MITHLVSLKLQDPSPENLAAAREKLLSMEGNIPQLRHLEVGVDTLRTARSFDLALITRFDAREDYEGYQNHPYHQNEVLPYLRSVLEKSIVVDYES